jgi:hypothetical protein
LFVVFILKLVMLTSGWWIWCGKPEGASNPDISLANHEIEELQELMEPRDLLIADRAFRSLRDSI